MTSNMIYIVALGVGFKCPRKIHLNTQCRGGPHSSAGPEQNTQLLSSIFRVIEVYVHICTERKDRFVNAIAFSRNNSDISYIQSKLRSKFSSMKGHCQKSSLKKPSISRTLLTTECQRIKIIHCNCFEKKTIIFMDTVAHHRKPKEINQFNNGSLTT